jgi:asparagine synthetase B (glutamine-hydrolysing)
VSRLAGVFAPQRQGAPTAERLAEALGPSAEFAAAGPVAVAWTRDASAQTSPVLSVTNSSSLPDAAVELESLRGRFALLRWDPGRAEGFLAVDPLGAASLFLHDDGSQLTFASEAADLLRILAVRPSPSRRAIVRWLADGSTERGETLFEGVRRLAGGHVVRLSRLGWTSDSYWAPRYTGIADGDVLQHRARLRGGVEAAVERATTGASRPGVLLSGGLDSATVAALAARAQSLRSYSAVFPDHADVDESGPIETLTAKFGVDARRIPVTRTSILSVAEEYIHTWRLPPGSPLLAVHRPLLRHVQDDGVDVLLDGQGGDELFGESPYLLADVLRGGRLNAARQLAQLISPREPLWRTLVDVGVKGNVPYAAHRAIRLYRPRRYAPHWLRPEAARLYAQGLQEWAWKKLDGPRWWAFLADQLTAQRERSGVHDYLRHKSALGQAEGRHPFLQDVDLVSFVLSLPPQLAFDSSFDRPLLRTSIAGLVPDEIRLKVAKPHFTRIFVEAMTGTDYEKVIDILRPEAEVYAFVRREAVENLFRATQRERRAFTWAWTLWRLAVCERWLQLQAAG